MFKGDTNTFDMDAPLESELRLEVRIWLKHNLDPRRRFLFTVTDGESRGHETRQIRIGSTKQRRRWGRGSEDDKVHAEEEHVVR